MKKLFFLLVFLQLFSSSCRKPVEDNHPELIGDWRFSDDDENQRILILSNTQGVYISGNTEIFYNAIKDYDKVRANDKNFTIGRKKFEFVSKPEVFDSTRDYSGLSGMGWMLRVGHLPTMKMKVRLPVLYGHNEIWLYKWDF